MLCYHLQPSAQSKSYWTERMSRIYFSVRNRHNFNTKLKDMAIKNYLAYIVFFAMFKVETRFKQ